MEEWYQWRPVETWPGVPTINPTESRFDTAISKTLKLLERECWMIHARNVVIQGYFDSEQIRIDGMIRANARPRKPGVIVSFEVKAGPMSFPCDTFQRWEDNLRAIALSLEALRSVDRYGVTRRAEQYRGWLALPEVISEKPEEIIARHARMTPAQVLADVHGAYIVAAKLTHPDQTGGSHEAFSEVRQALHKLRGAA